MSQPDKCYKCEEADAVTEDGLCVTCDEAEAERLYQIRLDAEYDTREERDLDARLQQQMEDRLGLADKCRESAARHGIGGTT